MVFLFPKENFMNKKKISFQLKLTLTFSIIAFLGLLSSNLIASYLSNQTLVGSITSFMHEKIKSYESTIEVTYQDNLDREKKIDGRMGRRGYQQNRFLC